MKRLHATGIIIAILGLSLGLAFGEDLGIKLVQPRLIELDSTPFYLQAVITENSDPQEHVDVEMFWAAPDRWRRAIKSREFTQTLIVNGDKVFEQDSGDYLPLSIQVLATAMVDPKPMIDAVRPSDPVRTKANGMTDESGKMCFGPDGKMCVMSRFGMTESLSGPGRAVDFMDYRKFKDKRVARRLIYRLDHGDSWEARVTALGEFSSHDEAQFAVPEPTARDKQIRSVVLAEAELRALSSQPVEVIWPQVLEDQNTQGRTSYYVSIDRTGKVREILPLSVAIERADDSARRQIMRWKFNPPTKDGVSVQAEGILTFNFDTRAYGPKAILTNEEARKLAENIVEPEFPPTATSGSTCTIRIAVDADGQVIEQIAIDCPGISQSCMNAIGKWHFSPIIENGQPQPYRAELTFRVPRS